jgi:hypothetical protein
MIDIDRKTKTLCQILAQEFYLTLSMGQGGRWGGGGVKDRGSGTSSIRRTGKEKADN